MNTQTNLSEKYLNGYNRANAVINQGGSAQELYNQSNGALDQNDFDKGWQQACIENGAKEPSYEQF